MVNVSDTIGNGNGAEKNTASNRKTYLSKDKAVSPWRHRRRGGPTSISRLILRLSALLVFGIGYGVIVMHLHNTKTFTPAWWEEIEGYNVGFLLLWGLVGVALGSLLPWIDFFLDESENGVLDGDGSGGMVDWMQVVRSIGAFVGIAYAIVRFPTNLATVNANSLFTAQTPLAIHASNLSDTLSCEPLLMVLG